MASHVSMLSQTRQTGKAYLDDSVADLGRRDDGECTHHAVRELLADLGDEQSTHAGTSSTTEGVGDLEALEAVTALSLSSDDIEDVVNELSTLGIIYRREPG